MQNKAISLKLPKYGVVDKIKERIVVNWLSTAEEAEVLEYAAGASAAASAPAAAVASSAASPGTEDAGQSEAAGNSGESSGKHGGNGDSFTLFGRSSLQMVPADVDDKTSFYADIHEGPSCDSIQTESNQEIIAAAEDGLLPLAGLVKISQGYQEVNGNQVAVLLAGIGWFGFNFCYYI